MKKNQCLVLLTAILLMAYAPQTASAKYTAQEGGVPQGGTVKGQVLFAGKAPAPAILKVDKDPSVCGTDRPSEELVVNAGGIQNAVVFIEGLASGKAWWKGSEKFVYDQKACRFAPHVLLVKPQTAGEVLNSDSVGHNFHTVSAGIFNINKKIKADGAMSVDKDKIKNSGKIRVKCDIHPWMGGWWFVAESPYTVLTDEKGHFSLTEVPPGKYTIKAWQEKLGEVSQEIEVTAQKTINLEIRMSLK